MREASLLASVRISVLNSVVLQMGRFSFFCFLVNFNRSWHLTKST